MRLLDVLILLELMGINLLKKGGINKELQKEEEEYLKRKSTAPSFRRPDAPLTLNKRKITRIQRILYLNVRGY